MTIADKLVRAKEDFDRVYEAGYEKGSAEGGGGSYDQGYADGKKSEYDAFWDAYQDNGNREEYSHAFGGIGWNNRTFKPKYDIKPNSSYMMFRQFAFDGDLVDCLDKLGITLDFSNSTNTVYMFALASKITHIGEIDARNTTSNTVFDMCFQNCSALKTIDKLKFKKGITGEFGTASFSNCTALENITMEGEIANNGLNLQYSPKLSRKSIESIVGCLSDDVSGKTIKLSKTAVESAFGSGTETENVLLGSFGNKTENGITFTDNNDGSFSVNGTSENTVFFEFAKIPVVANATYQMSLSSNGGTHSGAFSIIAQDSDGIGYDGVTVPTNTETEYVPMCDGYFVLTYETAQSMEYNNMIVTPSVRKSFTWDSLAASKPNWTITLV